ncbi:hypothetical protein I6F34_01165 [Bradyrhizobium sp. BRP05]|nr:hypothetical protein [Bradyrhizobium sp. BRP05]
MADDDRITLIIEGLPQDEGQVRLGAFMSQLQNLSATISKLDRDANEGKPATYYRIAELSYNSPVRVVLEPQALPKHPYIGHAIIESLEHVTHALQSGEDLAGFDADLLEDIRGLARPVGKTVANVTLLFNKHRFDFTPQVTSKVEAALAIDEECEGTIEGMLEQINLHHGANVFHIYPDVGPRKVTCHFPARLYDEAVSAIGRKVEVSGTLHYRSGASFPHQVQVSHIEAFPPEGELPNWDDLRGMVPGATGEMTSEEFIRELRDGWY